MMIQVYNVTAFGSVLFLGSVKQPKNVLNCIIKMKGLNNAWRQLSLI